MTDAERTMAAIAFQAAAIAKDAAELLATAHDPGTIQTRLSIKVMKDRQRMLSELLAQFPA